MGWTVADIRAASLWQFRQAFEGWKAANLPPEPPKPPTDERFETYNWDF